jgi:hypothetical protein
MLSAAARAKPSCHEVVPARRACARHVKHCDFVCELAGKKWAAQGVQAETLSRLFDTIGSTNKFFVEFGYPGRKLCEGYPNSCGLALSGWSGVYMDGSNSNPAINLSRAFITPDNIVSLLRERHVPAELDYLSIDIDSHDLWIAQEVLRSEYKPRLFSVEYNSNFPHGVALTLARPAAGGATDLPSPSQCAFGASASALEHMAHVFGYVPVAIERRLDIFFMRRDLAHANRVPRLNLADAQVQQNLHAPMSTADASRFVDYPVWLAHSDLDVAHPRGRGVQAADAVATARQALAALAANTSLTCFRNLRAK